MNSSRACDEVLTGGQWHVTTTPSALIAGVILRWNSWKTRKIGEDPVCQLFEEFCQDLGSVLESVLTERKRHISIVSWPTAKEEQRLNTTTPPGDCGMKLSESAHSLLSQKHPSRSRPLQLQRKHSKPDSHRGFSTRPLSAATRAFSRWELSERVGNFPPFPILQAVPVRLGSHIKAENWRRLMAGLELTRGPADQATRRRKFV